MHRPFLRVLSLALMGLLPGCRKEYPNPFAQSARTLPAPASAAVEISTGLWSGQANAPRELFALSNLANWKGWVFLVLGGFLVGFGTRYAGGCTSGHAISGLSNLNGCHWWPSSAFSPAAW